MIVESVDTREGRLNPFQYGLPLPGDGAELRNKLIPVASRFGLEAGGIFLELPPPLQLVLAEMPHPARVHVLNEIGGTYGCHTFEETLGFIRDSAPTYDLLLEIVDIDLLRLTGEVASGYGGQEEIAFWELLHPSVREALVRMSASLRGRLLREISEANHCPGLLETFQLIGERVKPEGGHCLLPRTERKHPGLSGLARKVEEAVSGRREVVEGEEDLLLWRFGQRAHEATLALHTRTPVEPWRKRKDKRRPWWREPDKGKLEIFLPSPSQESFLVLEEGLGGQEKEVGFSLERGKRIIYPPVQAVRREGPVFDSQTGQLGLVIVDRCRILLESLGPLPLNYGEFEQLLNNERRQSGYQELVDLVRGVLPPWPELRKEYSEQNAKFGLASTIFAIAQEITNPLASPCHQLEESGPIILVEDERIAPLPESGVPILTEMPIGQFPFQIDGKSGRARNDVSLTVGRPDAIVIAGIDGQPVTPELAQWIRNTREQYGFGHSGWKYVRDKYKETRTWEYTLRHLIADACCRVGPEAKINLEVVEHKMQAGDASPGFFLDFETIRREANLGHVHTMWEYLFGTLVVNALTRRMLLESPERFLRDLDGKSPAELDVRLDYFMDHLNIDELVGEVLNQGLFVTGRLIYHFPGRRVVYTFNLDGSNLKEVWEKELLSSFRRAITKRQATEAVDGLIALLPEKEITVVKRRSKKREIPSGWENWIVKEGGRFYLDPERFLQMAEIQSWTLFENEKVLVLRVSMGEKAEEIRINLDSLKFRVGSSGGWLRLAKYVGFRPSKATKDELKSVWEDSWAKKRGVIEGATVKEKVMFGIGGDLQPSQKGIWFDPWRGCHVVTYTDLVKEAERERSELEDIEKRRKGGERIPTRRVYFFTPIFEALMNRRERMVRCPFPDHPDRHASAHVYCKGRNVFCFSCQRNLRVIGMPRGEEGAGIDRIEVRRGRRELPLVTDERGDVLEWVWQDYQSHFPNSPAFEYLARVRGIDPQKAYEKGLVGYDDGEFAERVKSGETPLTLEGAIDYQVLRVSDKGSEPFDFLDQMIAFPLMWAGENGVFAAEAGRVSNFLARSLEEKTFLKLKEPDEKTGYCHGIFGWDTIDWARERGEIVVVEAPIDALTLRLQMGFDDDQIPVISISGLGHTEIRILVEELGLRRVYLGTNPDQPGERAFGRISNELANLGVEVVPLVDLLVEKDPELDPGRTKWLSGKEPSAEEVKKRGFSGWKDPNELITSTVAGQKYCFIKASW